MKMDAKRESAADLRNLILYNPETGKTRKIRPGFSWLFLLIGPFGFFFRGMVKEGLLWVLGLAVACRLFDSEVGYYPLFDFKHVGYGIGIALSFIGNYYCLERLLEQGYNLDRTSLLAAADTLKRCWKYLKNDRYAEIRHKLEQVAARDGA